jgi:hypothetical protein
MRRSMLRPLPRRNPYSASLGQSLLAFFQPSLAFAKASPSVKAQAAAPAAAAHLTVGTVITDIAQAEMLPIGSVVLVGYYLEGGTKTGKVMTLAGEKSASGWQAKQADGKVIGAPAATFDAGFVGSSAQAPWAAIVLRMGHEGVGTFSKLEAALPDAPWIAKTGTVAESLAAWFPTTPFAPKSAAAPKPAEPPDVLPPGASWVTPITASTIDAAAPAGMAEGVVGNKDWLDEGSVICFYSSNGEQAFYQRSSTSYPYFVRVNEANGEFSPPPQHIDPLLNPKSPVYPFAASGGSIVAVLYLGDADPAGDDPNAMLELLAKAPLTAKSAPNYVAPSASAQTWLAPTFGWAVMLPNAVGGQKGAVIALYEQTYTGNDPKFYYKDATNYWTARGKDGVPAGTGHLTDAAMAAAASGHYILLLGTASWSVPAIASVIAQAPKPWDVASMDIASIVAVEEPEPEPEPIAAAPAKPKKGTAAAQSIKTLTATSMKTLAPLIKKAAAKVEGVSIETKGSQVTMTKGTATVRIGSVSGSGITFLFTDAATGATAMKSMTIPLPDAAANVATVIAQAMVYFLVYTLRSQGKAHEEVPLPPPVMEVGGVMLLPGSTIWGETQRTALPDGTLLIPPPKEFAGGAMTSGAVYTVSEAPLPATIAYLPVFDWSLRYKPLTDTPLALAAQGIVIPAPKRAGWPASPFAPTTASYSSLPIGSLIRTESLGSTVYYGHESKYGYRRIDPSTGAFDPNSLTVRSPAKMAELTTLNYDLQVFAIYVGSGKVEDPSVYLPWMSGVEVDKADTLASAAVAQVAPMAVALGIDPRVAALFTPAVLQVMLAQKGIPYQGKTFAPPKPAGSPLLTNPSRHREAVRRVLRNPNPSMRDLQDAELLEAAGLPLHDCLPANRRRNPAGGATAQEAGIIKGVVDALKAALGNGPQPELSSAIVQTINARLANMYNHGDDGSSYADHQMSRPEYAELAQFLRYLVAARVVGLWKNYIDPGERSVTRALGLGLNIINDPTQSLRPNEVTRQQIALLKSKGLLTTPTTLFTAANTWLRQQATGVGWYRRDTGAKWTTADLTPPYTANLPSLTTYQHENTFQAATAMTTLGEYSTDDTWAGPKPYPKWAGEPWANVEGLCIDYYDQTFKQYVISEWSAPLFGYTGAHTLQVRANTRDPRFVLLPGTVLGRGPMKKFRDEGAVIFVTIDDQFPLKADIITVGTMGNSPGKGWDDADFGRLTDEQLIAWGLARPAFPSGPKPGPSNGPAYEMPLKTNPSRLNAKNVHALLFSRSKWGPGAVRAWLAKNGLEGLAVEAAGGAWRVSVYAADAFAPGSIRRQNVADGVIALVGRPV